MKRLRKPASPALFQRDDVLRWGIGCGERSVGSRLTLSSIMTGKNAPTWSENITSLRRRLFVHSRWSTPGKRSIGGAFSQKREVRIQQESDPIRSLASSARLMIAQTVSHYRVIEKPWWGGKESVYHECAVPYTESKGHSPSQSK